MCDIITGRVLGGGSGVNQMMYLRGSPKDFDDWARTTGDPVWAHNNVLKAFKKSENYHGFFFPPGKSNPNIQSGSTN